MDIKRRNLLTEPEDTLLLSKSSLEALSRFSEWSEATGQGTDEYTANTLCAVPIPVYSQPAPGERRFKNVNPRVMWHPLFWLPERVGGSYRIASGPNGELEFESEAIRSIRIAMELSASGLYDQATGGWVDVMALAGINVENPNDIERIRTWQLGRPDQVLDSIDLTKYLQVGDSPNWALESALLLQEKFTQAGWAILADSLVELIDDAAQPVRGAVDLTDLRSTTALAAFLASTQLYAVPVSEGESTADFWDRLENEAKAGVYRDANHFLDGPAAEAAKWLSDTRDKFWPSVEELQNLNN